MKADPGQKGQEPHNRTTALGSSRRGERTPVWRKAAPLPGLCADGAAFLAQGSDTRPSFFFFFFFMWAAHCSSAVGVAPFVPALPLLEKKACMISYMKDICNWTAGPMQYIYNSKQNTFEPVSSVSPLSLPGETYLHIFKYTRSKTRQNTGYRSRYTFYISHERGERP